MRKRVGGARAAGDAHRDRSEAGLQGARQTGGRAGGRKACTVHHALPGSLRSGVKTRADCAFSRPADRPADGARRRRMCSSAQSAQRSSRAPRSRSSAPLPSRTGCASRIQSPDANLSISGTSLGARLLRTSLMLSRASPFRCAGSGKTWTGIPIIAANMDTTGTFGELLLLFRDKDRLAASVGNIGNKAVWPFSKNRNQLPPPHTHVHTNSHGEGLCQAQDARGHEQAYRSRGGLSEESACVCVPATSQWTRRAPIPRRCAPNTLSANRGDRGANTSPSGDIGCPA